MHLNRDHYLDALKGAYPLPALARLAEQHLTEVCATCSTAVERAGSTRPRLSSPTLASSTGLDPRHLTQADVDAATQHLTRLRTVAASARQDLQRLLELPTDRWAARIDAARTRMRSRTFAELLLAESRSRIRTEPRTAAALAELVPRALRWTDERPDLSWVAPLLARATAHQANALRVAGDLPAADRLFATLSLDTLGDTLARAEIASLEASLRIGQRKFERAAHDLDRALAAYTWAGHLVGAARVLIKCANLQRTLGQPEAVVPLLDRAASSLAPAADPYLLAVTVTGRVNALCDLDRAEEAAPLLDDHRALYVEQGEDYTLAIYALLRGRVALGLDELADSERLLTDARDRLLALDRDYDAILTSLYLADALLAAGKTADLQQLAAELVPLFKARGVARETLAALHLLAKAAQAERVTAAILAEVRGRLHAASRS